MRGRQRLRVAQVFVANLPLFAFGLHVAPAAGLTDELLDIVAVEGQGPGDVVPMLRTASRATAATTRRIPPLASLVRRLRVDEARLPVLASLTLLSAAAVAQASAVRSWRRPCRRCRRTSASRPDRSARSCW